MLKRLSLSAVAAALVLSSVSARGESVMGVVQDASGSPLRGVMVSAIDPEKRKSVSVLSAADGTFTIDGLSSKTYDIRGRFIGLEDNTIEGIAAGSSDSASLTLNMNPAKDINLQRPGDNLLSLLKFDNITDKENFKMACVGCHQVGTLGFRSPDEPVDWITMVTRMDGFGGLNKHLKETIVTRLLDAYSVEAEENWPAYSPAEPEDSVLVSRITEWDVGQPEDNNCLHDVGLGKDGAVYAVDQLRDVMFELDTKTGERTEHKIPGGIHRSGSSGDTEGSNYKRGPHSVEADADGNMWLTLSYSGEMAKFDVTTKEFMIVSSRPASVPRGGYPHTLRMHKKTAHIWYTDSQRGVYRLIPNPPYEVKEYKLPSANQTVGGGRGETGGLTPYGLDIAPDGMIWYSKLSGNRVGRINPNVEDGDVKEWNPPFLGPRRLHVAPDGMVWVPSWGSGVIGRFNPQTEEWKIYYMPDSANQTPYALNVNPKNGDVWICSSNSDSLVLLDPKTGHFTNYRMPSRVSFSREIEFDEDGNIWTSNSNGPIRHSERGVGSIIKLEPRI